MSYRSNPQYYRSWNALALGIKTEGPEEPNKIDGLLSKDRQRPRRESWSQPPQRGRGPLRGRGTWYIDNRRPQNRRRYTMPDSQDYSYHSNYEPSDYNQLEDNPIIEEPRNLSVSPESDYSDVKSKDEERSDYQDETSSWERKQYYPTDNIYRPPRSRSASWHQKSNSSSDDGSQSRYSNGSSKKYEPENYKAQRKNSWEREPEPEPDQAWVHDKFEFIDSDFENKKDQKDQKYKKERKDASTQVTQIDINNELKKHNIKEITACEFSKKINKPESPKDQANPSAIAELPKEITIKFSELMKESIDEKPESMIPQTLDSKNEELSIEPEVASEAKFEEILPEIISEATPGVIIPPEVAPETPNVVPGVIPEVEVEITSEETTSEVTDEVIPESPEKKEELQIQILINLDEDNETNIQPIQPKISKDIYALDWGSYQKTLMEEEIRLTMEQPVKMSTPHKLDTELKDFDSLL